MITMTPHPALEEESRVYPVLPLRDLVVFPFTTMSLTVSRQKSIDAVERALQSDSIVLLATQMAATDEDPAADALPRVVTLGRILEVTELPNRDITALIEGTKRAQVITYTARPDYHEATATVVEDTIGDMGLADWLVRSVLAQFEKCDLHKGVSCSVITAAQQIDGYGRIADTLAAAAMLRAQDKQRILETFAATERLALLHALIEAESSVLQVEKGLRVKVSRNMFHIV